MRNTDKHVYSDKLVAICYHRQVIEVRKLVGTYIDKSSIHSDTLVALLSNGIPWSLHKFYMHPVSDFIQPPKAGTVVWLKPGVVQNEPINDVTDLVKEL